MSLIIKANYLSRIGTNNCKVKYIKKIVSQTCINFWFKFASYFNAYKINRNYALNRSIQKYFRIQRKVVQQTD